jgi:hypothetical protein
MRTKIEQKNCDNKILSFCTEVFHISGNVNNKHIILELYFRNFGTPSPVYLSFIVEAINLAKFFSYYFRFPVSKIAKYSMLIFHSSTIDAGAWGNVVVKALRY